MLNKIKQIIQGLLCPKCGATTLYKLSDHRHKCKSCQFKFSAQKIEHELTALQYFSLEVPANKASQQLSCNFRKVSNKYKIFRDEVCRFLAAQDKDKAFESALHKLESPVDNDNKSRRQSKALVVYEHKGSVRSCLLSRVNVDAVQQIIQKNNIPALVYSAEAFKSYKSLKFQRTNILDLTAEQQKKLSALKGFWSFAQERFFRYHGISENNLETYLKEIEFRFNHRKENLFDLLVKIHYGPENT